MAKRIKNENQGLLFDIAPEPKSLKKSIPKIAHKPKDQAMVVVCYKDNISTSHWVTPLQYMESIKELKISRGYEVETMLEADYWRGYRSGKYRLGEVRQ